MSQGKKYTGDVWDVKGKDVPGKRFSRSVMKGLTNESPKKQKAEKKKRHKALDRIRVHARNLDDERDRTALWDLVRKIGYNGFPTWEEVTEAVTATDFLALAHRGELHAETRARKDRDAEVSERRTCAHSVRGYLNWQEREEFAQHTQVTAASVLRRMLKVQDQEESSYAQRRVATLTRSDGSRILADLAESPRTGERVTKRTRAKNRKILRAWLNWELKMESMRAEDQDRQPLYSVNVFNSDKSGFSAPTKDSKATVEDTETRRFWPDEMDRLLKAASTMWRHILMVVRCLGLRPGEFIHLRWLDDVIPLEDGFGYEVRIEGGRGKDKRCSCLQCRSNGGWAPKNGPRRYVLDRRNDELGWIAPACDALDAWVAMRRPSRGDFVFPNPHDHERAWSNQKLNEALHELGEKAGVVTGLDSRGSKTFHSLRHTAASELLELGISHPHAAYWIGDTLREFQRTYGRPSDEAMSEAIFS